MNDVGCNFMHYIQGSGTEKIKCVSHRMSCLCLYSHALVISTITGCEIHGMLSFREHLSGGSPYDRNE